MEKIIFLKPYLVDKIWGGHNLKRYHIYLGKMNTGEAWVISGIPNKVSNIKVTSDVDLPFDDYYRTRPAFFNHYPSKTYPLLVKLLDCNDHLSIQVHPTDAYHNKHPEALTKNEAWLILEAKPNAKIVYGHTAKTKSELEQLVKNDKWNKLLTYQIVKKGDFIYVPSGTLHALGAGLLILEIQQPSDTTYRLYDYHRELKDPSRTLHVKQALECTTTPFQKPVVKTRTDGTYVTPYFCVRVINNTQLTEYNFSTAYWLQLVVIEGKGIIDDMYRLKKGDTLLVGNNQTYFELSGNIKVVVSYIEKPKH